jgi:peptidyl-prolyl cis-trans isomerase D
MFDFFRKHMRIMQFLLVLLIFPSFIVFGIQGYNRLSDGAHSAVATVDGQGITQAEWDAASRDQLLRAQRQQPNVDAKLFDTPRMRRAALDAVVRDRVMLATVDKLHIYTTDERLQRLFATDPAFETLRNPDGSVNKEFLAMQGLSSEGFAQRLRQEMSVRQVVQGVTGTTFASATDAATALDALFQRREVQVQRFDVKDYLAKVSPTDADIEKFYKDPVHAEQFKAPEQADIEYVVLDLDAVMKNITVPEEDLRKYYAENEKQRYTTPEERRASHILIKADKGAPKAERDQAKAKAEALLAELKKNPASFADVARKNSEDPGSAEKGGDLDYFSRGMMVKPFDDAAFALKPGEMSGIVETDYGYHIIKLADVRGGEKRSFESVRPEIEAEVKKQLAQKKFSEQAADFTNVVYEQSDALKPAADKFKLELRKAESVPRVPAPGASGPLASPKFLDALFGNDALRNKRNTDAVETAPNQLVSGRVVKYAPAHTIPLAEVKTRVREQLVAEQAAALARKDGEARLAQAGKDPKTALPVETVTVSRIDAKNLPREVIEASLKADAGKLPAATGVDVPGVGYAVIRITNVLPRDAAMADENAVKSQYAQAWSEAEMLAYYSALKTRFKVEVKEPAAAASAAAK